MQRLPKFQKGQVLTASKLNDLVEMLNDHEARIRSQKLQTGAGYNFSISEGGTQLTITGKGNGSGSDEYTHPFKVFCISGNFYSKSKETDCNFAISATSGTVFGTGGSSSNYEYIDASEDDRDDEDNCRLYAYIDIEEEGDYMVFAKLKVQALASMPFIEGNDEDINTLLASVLAVAIPFNCEFQWIDAEKLSEWQGDAHGDIGGIVIEKPENDDEYGLGSVYEVHFPLAIINFEETSTGNLSQGNTYAVKKITQILHSDIYWYGHKARSI